MLLLGMFLNKLLYYSRMVLSICIFRWLLPHIQRLDGVPQLLAVKNVFLPLQNKGNTYKLQEPISFLNIIPN